MGPSSHGSTRILLASNCLHSLYCVVPPPCPSFEVFGPSPPPFPCRYLQEPSPGDVDRYTLDDALVTATNSTPQFVSSNPSMLLVLFQELVTSTCLYKCASSLDSYLYAPTVARESGSLHLSADRLLRYLVTWLPSVGYFEILLKL